MSPLDKLATLFGFGAGRASADGMIAQADAARDRRAWTDAAAFYRSALDLDPRAGIWVQYGHALKESGDLAGGKAAYLSALELEPHNSDTALQLGHVVKLMGESAEAIEWYTKALSWPPGEPSAEHELLSLGVGLPQIEALPEPTELASPSPSTLTAHGSVLWDVTPLNEAMIRGDMAAHAFWTGQLAQAVVTDGSAVPCVLSRDTLQWRVVCDTEWLPAAQKGAAKPLVEAQLAPLPQSLAALVLTPDVSLDDCNVPLAIDTLIGDHGAGIILNFATVPAWWMHLPDDEHEQVRLIARLDDLMLRSNAVLAATEADARIFRQRASFISPHHPVEVLVLQAQDIGGIPSGDARNEGPDVALAPSDDVELQAILTSHAQLSPPRDLILVSPPQDIEQLTLRVSSGWPKRQDIRIVSPPAALRLLPSARSLLAPEAGPGATAWIACALGAAVPVLARRSSRHHEMFGSSLGLLGDFRVPGQLGQWWQSQLARKSVRHSWTADVIAIVQAFSIGAKRALSARHILASGKFYDFSTNGAGLLLRHGSTWGRQAAYGSLLTDAAAALRLRLPRRSRGRMRLAMLVGVNPYRACDVVLRAAVAGDVQETITALPEEGWGWMTIDVEVSSEPGSTINLTAEFIPPQGQQLEGVALTGLIMYPLTADHLWFEFLDRASRGLIPAVRAVRLWAERGRRA